MRTFRHIDIYIYRLFVIFERTFLRKELKYIINYLFRNIILLIILISLHTV